MSSREEKLNRMQELGLASPETTKIVKKDFETVLEEEHAKRDDKTASLVSLIQDRNISIELS